MRYLAALLLGVVLLPMPAQALAPSLAGAAAAVNIINASNAATMRIQQTSEELQRQAQATQMEQAAEEKAEEQPAEALPPDPQTAVKYGEIQRNDDGTFSIVGEPSPEPQLPPTDASFTYQGMRFRVYFINDRIYFVPPDGTMAATIGVAPTVKTRTRIIYDSGGMPIALAMAVAFLTFVAGMLAGRKLASVKELS